MSNKTIFNPAHRRCSDAVTELVLRFCVYWPNRLGWRQKVLQPPITFMILSWWCPLGQGKWHLPAIQFILAVRLIPILTHLSSRWTVPLKVQRRNPNQKRSALWRIFSTNKSATANRKKGFYTNCDPNKAGGWIYFCLKRLRTLKSFQILKTELINQKPIAVDDLFKTYPMVPVSCRSNLAGRYLYKGSSFHAKIQEDHTRILEVYYYLMLIISIWN
jgi:hypothetical protein